MKCVSTVGARETINMIRQINSSSFRLIVSIPYTQVCERYDLECDGWRDGVRESVVARHGVVDPEADVFGVVECRGERTGRGGGRHGRGREGDWG